MPNLSNKSTEEFAASSTGVNFSIDPLVGRSPQMLQVFNLIREAAATRSPVLISGETGTGKDLAARTIHWIGPWSEQPFVPVDCPALAPTLIESELFGHVRGAFTGAISGGVSLFRSARDGSIFLDEIADLPLELQSRLLRAIEEHDCKPVGSTSRVRLKARILAATNRDLVSAVREGSFRKDLYFRLNVISIALPPLRERKMDIPLLAERILEKLCVLCRTNGAGGPFVLSQEALNRLLEYDWPGNIRELRNCLERAMTSCDGPVIRAEDLFLNSELACPKQEHTSNQNIIPLKELEKQTILQAISVTGGDKLLAARLLGIGKTTLYRKLRAYREQESE